MNESILVKVGADLSDLQKGMKSATSDITGFGTQMASLGKTIQTTAIDPMRSLGFTTSRTLKGMSAESVGMYNEMKSAFTKQKETMMGFADDMVKVKYGYFQMAQGAKDYTGTTDEFMSGIQKLGKEHKTVTENMIKNNELMKTSFFNTIGTMLNRSTQASKIADNFTRMNNPMYNVNKAGLAVADGLNKIAIQGNASVLALKMLGPTANMKALKDMTMMISQGLMRFTAVALIAAVGAAVFYKKIHEGAMKLDAEYKATFENMVASVKKALEPMIQVFADVMTPVFALVGKIADLVVKFNEANPAIAKIIGGFVLLLPALTLLLAPLAIGIGLTGGLTAAFGALWVVIGPIVTGFAAMMGTVLLVAAGITALAAGVIYAYKHFEGFRNVVDSVLTFLKTTFTTVFNAIKTVVTQVIGAIVAFSKTQLDKFAAFWKENGAQISSIVKGAFTLVSLYISTYMATIKAVFQTVWPIITTVIKVAWESIKLIVSTAINLVLGVIQTVLKLMKGDWSGAWDTIKETTSKVMGDVLKFLKNIDLLQIGKDLIAGLVKGISNKFEDVKKKVADLANLIPKWAKDFLGIHSPSRVMAEIGKFTGEGLAEGIASQVRNVKSATSLLANAAEDTMIKASSKAFGGMSLKPTLAYDTPNVKASTFTANTHGTVEYNANSEQNEILTAMLDALERGHVLQMDGHEVARLQQPHLNKLGGQSLNLAMYTKGAR